MELWKDVVGSRFYQVNNMGRIKVRAGSYIRKDGKPYTVKEHIVTPFMSKAGYYIVNLHYDIECKYLVHRLVLETFNPCDGMETLFVNHKNGDKKENALSNLEWCTRTENARHAMRMGLFKPQERYGEKHPMTKLSSEVVREIRNSLCGKHGEQHALALKYKVSDCTISEIKSGRSRARG